MDIYELIERHEGNELYPYRCPAGKLTIGIGRNLDDRGISPDEAQYMLRNDVAIADEELQREFPWFFKLNRARQNALIDLAINMGMPTLIKFRKTLDHIAAGRYDEAAAELLRGTGPGGKSRYYAQVGKRAETIAEIIRTGEMPK